MNLSNYAPTVHYPYADISGVVDIWSKSCQAMAVFEHGPDEGQASLHCHFYMLGCSIGIEGLKKQFHSNFLTFKTRNELWAWTHKEFPVIEALDTSGGLQYLKYMTKGHIAPSFLKNISLDKVKEAQALWVNKSPVQAPVSILKSDSEFDIILKTLQQKYINDDYRNLSVLQFKRDICHIYLSKRRPVPRTGDLNRYSYSAYMILRNDKSHNSLATDIIEYVNEIEDKKI